MALRWSSEFTVAEFRNLKAKSIALDCTGNFLFLPGKQHIGIKDLNSPIEEIITFPRISKYEPRAVAWNPQIQHLSALCSDIRVELLTWKNKSELGTENLLKSHTRVVTDINWNPIDPNIIASSSLDTFTYIWDIRESPVSHVKWNGTSRHLLATTHNGDVKIWDERKASSPVQYISAHLTSIHSFDWDPLKEHKLFTASQDGTIKFFDFSHPRKTECIINADAPVWKASYTPFGRGMLAIIIPNNKKTDNTLLLWNLTNSSVPLHTFVGHTEIVLDFQWRRQNESDYQLITWSKDQTLRIWELDKYLQELCDSPGTELETDCVDGTAVTSKQTEKFTDVIEEKKLVKMESEKDLKLDESALLGGHGEINVKSISISSDISGKELKKSESNNAIEVKTIQNGSIPMNLQQEFSKPFNVPNVQIQKTDIVRRVCSVIAKCNGQTVSLLINFPPSYPRNKAPIFQFDQSTTVPHSLKFKLLEVLRDTADLKVKNNQACLEACLRTLITTMQKTTASDADKINLFSKDRPLSDRISPFGSTHEAYFLPARTCGAKFCHTGSLICFAKPLTQVLSSDKNFCGLVSLSGRQTEALTRLYLQNKNGTLPPRTKYMIRRGLLKRMKNTHKNKRTVIVYDVSCLFLFNYELATKYILSGSDLVSICKHNAEIVNSIGRRDLYQIWNLVLLVASANSNNLDNFKDHPLAKEMLHSIISYYISQSDLQTAAALCCVFKKLLNCHPQNSYKPITNLVSESPYHTVHLNESPMENVYSFPTQKHIRSNSWSEYLEDYMKYNNIERGEILEANEAPGLNSSSTKDESNELLYDRVKKAYADVLYRWDLLNMHATVMKCVKTAKAEVHRGIELTAECKLCKNSVKDKMCSSCKVPALYCVICRLSVKGLANVCIYCGHGGHLFHMKKWYELQSFCPAGCKCQCSMTLYSTKY